MTRWSPRVLRYSPRHVRYAEGLADRANFAQNLDERVSDSSALDALRIFDGRPDYRSGRIAMALHVLGETHFKKGDPHKVEAWLRRLSAVNETLAVGQYDEPPWVAAHALGMLGHVLVRQGRLDEAESALTESLRLYRTKVGASHQRYMGVTLEAKTRLAQAQGDASNCEAAALERRKFVAKDPKALFGVVADLARSVPMVTPTRGVFTPSQLAQRRKFTEGTLETLRMAAGVGYWVPPPNPGRRRPSSLPTRALVLRSRR